MLPSLFVSHGAPDFALKPGAIGRRLGVLGQRLGRARAVIVVSAHWQAAEVRITGHCSPPTLHDFRGFDPALRDLVYPAPGDPKLAERLAHRLRAEGWSTAIDPSRGFDHGAWVPLLHLFPNADVPVIQLALPWDLDGAGACQLGRALAPLRAEDVLILGSGSLTHGLRDFFSHGTEGRQEARAFRDWLREAVQSGDEEALRRGWTRAPGSARTHPTAEHYLPLPLAAGAGGLDAVEWIEGGWMGQVISMDACLFGAGGGDGTFSAP
jgi:4,5-DOPA dioxygenase extradiol